MINSVKIIYKIILKINFQSIFKSLRKKPFLAFSTSSISKTFREGVVVNFQLRDFFVLIGSNGNELSLFVDVSSEGRQRNPWDIRTSHDVKSGLIFVHRIQDRLNYIVSFIKRFGLKVYGPRRAAWMPTPNWKVLLHDDILKYFFSLLSFSK